MIFGQLSNRDSLSDLMVALDVHAKKSYHLGIGRSVTKSNLAKANQRRDSRIFEEVASHMVALAREKCPGDDFSLQGKVYAFDSSTIDLCLNVFLWAGFPKAKGGIKLHTLLDINCQIPVFVHITELWYMM